jgi:hypothetical protein
LGVIATQWVASAAPGHPPDPSDWDRLLERLLDTVGSGYLPRHEGSRPGSPTPRTTDLEEGNDDRG